MKKTNYKSKPLNKTTKVNAMTNVSTIVCMNCERKGHFYRNCFQQLDQQLINKRLFERKLKTKRRLLGKT